MPAVPQHMYGQSSQPSCFDKMKYGLLRSAHDLEFVLKSDMILGFTVGFCVGMASGALFGGFSALR
jgi:hypothetical protein